MLTSALRGAEKLFHDVYPKCEYRYVLDGSTTNDFDSVLESLTNQSAESQRDPNATSGRPREPPSHALSEHSANVDLQSLCKSLLRSSV